MLDDAINYWLLAAVAGAGFLFQFYMLAKLDNYINGSIHKSIFSYKSFPKYPLKAQESEMDLCRAVIKRNMLTALLLGAGGIASIMLGSFGSIMRYVMFSIYLPAFLVVVIRAFKPGKGRELRVFKDEMYHFSALSQLAGLILPLYFIFTMARYFGFY